ncbi:hypothetical protein GDO86_018914, partial [Hymenochirus boettgeri]
ETIQLPFLKQEDQPPIVPQCPSFQCVLCASSSPAVKLHEETLTYLNQGQSYEIRMLSNWKGITEMSEGRRLLRSVVRVVFHDRRLQYSERQQLESWQLNHPGDRILHLDVPLSVGVIDPLVNPNTLNTIEFLWDPSKRTSIFIQVHCISTEFTQRKNGGEKGAPFRIQMDTYKADSHGGSTEHLYSCSCQVKVFKQSLGPSASITETQQWLVRNRFSNYCRTFSNFTGADILKLSRKDLTQICGVADGIRLAHSLTARSVRPRSTLYISTERTGKKHSSNDTSQTVYQEVYLEDMTAAELTTKIADLFGIPANHIQRISKTGPQGIHILLTDTMVRHITDESCFTASLQKLPDSDGYHCILQ